MAPIHREDEYEAEDSDDEDAFVAPHPHLHEALPDGWEDSYGEYVYPEVNKRVEEILENGGSGVDFVDSWPDDEDEGFEDGPVSNVPEGPLAPMQDERSSALLVSSLILNAAPSGTHH